jgi:threonine aldolase
MRFLNEYATAANIEDERAQDMFEENLAKTLNNDIDSLHRGAEVKNLYNDIANLITAKLKDDKTAKAEAKKIREEYKSEEKGAKLRAIKTAETLGETLIPEEELKEFVIQSLSKH